MGSAPAGGRVGRDRGRDSARRPVCGGVWAAGRDVAPEWPAACGWTRCRGGASRTGAGPRTLVLGRCRLRLRLGCRSARSLRTRARGTGGVAGDAVDARGRGQAAAVAVHQSGLRSSAVPCCPRSAAGSARHARLAEDCADQRGGREGEPGRGGEHGIAGVLLQKRREVSDAYRVPGTPSAVLVSPREPSPRRWRRDRTQSARFWRAQSPPRPLAPRAGWR